MSIPFEPANEQATAAPTTAAAVASARLGRVDVVSKRYFMAGGELLADKKERLAAEARRADDLAEGG